jgi:hypothetical protein
MSTSVLIGTWKMLPTLARTAFGLCGSTDSADSTTASAPAASAVRIRVPTLPGSRTWTPAAISVPVGANGDDALRGDGLAQRLDGGTVDLEPRDAGGRGQVVEVAMTGRDLGLRVHLDDELAVLECLPDCLRALDQETAGFTPERTSGEPPSLLDAR